MWKLKWWCVAGLLLVCVFLRGQKDNSLPFHPDVLIGQLDNGLTYYFQANNKPEDRVELRLGIKAGSLQEEEHQLGLAHFVEHMAFNGSAHFEKNELIEYLESTGMRFGPDLNAYTSFDQTVYLLQARTDSAKYLDKALLILEDWASGLSFDPEEVEKERGVVVSEWRTRLSPEQRLRQQYLPIIYQDSRYAERLPIGNPEIIEKAPLTAITSFYNDWYRPDLMGLIIVGDIDVEKMEAEVKKRFSRLQNPAIPKKRLSYDIPKHEAPRFAIFSDKEAPFTEIELIIKHERTPLENKTQLKQHIAHSLYNRMLNSRMQEIQRLPDPPFTFAYSGYGRDLGPLDAYRMSAFVREGAALEGLGAVLKATRRAQLHGFTQSELDRQKAVLLNNLEQTFNEKDKISSDVWAGRNLNHFMEGGPLFSPEQNLRIHQEILPEITLEDINRLPDQWLKADNRVFVVTGPQKEATPLPDEEDLLRLVDSIWQLEPAPFKDTVINAPLIDTVLSAVPVVEEKQIPELGIIEWTLENGVRVILKPTNFRNDEILMSGFSPGGHSVYPDSMFRSADVAAFLVSQSGVGPFGYLEKEKVLAGKRVSVSPYISESYEGISGNSEVAELETMLQLTYLYFTAPKKNEQLFESYIKRQESIVQNMYNNPYYHFADLKNRLKYGSHPRKQTISMEEVQKIELDEAFQIYTDRFADAGDFTFVFVGNFSPETVKPLVSTYLGNLPVLGRNENWKNTHSGLQKGLIDTVVYKGQAEKSLVEIIYHGELTEENFRFAFSALTTIFRDRLRESLREEKGGVYTVNVRPAASRVPDSTYRITLSFNCAPKAVHELIDLIDLEAERLKSEEVEEKELSTIKEKFRQSRISDLKENQFWLSQLSARYRYDLPLENILLEQLEKLLDQLTPESIRQAAQTYLSKENYIELILFPEEFKDK